MRRCEYHRARSKVALLLLINLIMLLGGRYTVLLTIFAGGFSGGSTAFAKVAKKKPLKKHPMRPNFLWPVSGMLTSYYGTREDPMGGESDQFHAGIDISVPSGTAARAAWKGIVVFAGYNDTYGKMVKIDHLNGFSTLYAHNSRLLVHAGQRVKAGAVIAFSGSTGRSTGPHLHFEVHKDGWPANPLRYLHAAF